MAGQLQQHLLSTKELKREFIELLFEKTRELKKQWHTFAPDLSQENLALVFWEASTRTRCSFERAAGHIGARVSYINARESSVQKGESVFDTIKTLFHIGYQTFVMRHPHSGVFVEVQSKLPQGCTVINAGDGTNEHPTQALLDAFTLTEVMDLAGKKIAIVGDVMHSRVAHSNIYLLHLLGAQVSLFAPEQLRSQDLHDSYQYVRWASSLEQAIEGANVVMVLRVQDERLHEKMQLSPQEYFASFGITRQRLQDLPKLWLMHPGPFRCGFEIEESLVDDPRSLIWKQVENGVYVRAALMRLLKELRL